MFLLDLIWVQSWAVTVYTWVVWTDKWDCVRAFCIQHVYSLQAQNLLLPHTLLIFRYQYPVEYFTLTRTVKLVYALGTLYIWTLSVKRRQCLCFRELVVRVWIVEYPESRVFLGLSKRMPSFLSMVSVPSRIQWFLSSIPIFWAWMNIKHYKQVPGFKRVQIIIGHWWSLWLRYLPPWAFHKPGKNLLAFISYHLGRIQENY